MLWLVLLANLVGSNVSSVVASGGSAMGFAPRERSVLNTYPFPTEVLFQFWLAIRQTCTSATGLAPQFNAPPRAQDKIMPAPASNPRVSPAQCTGGSSITCTASTCDAEDHHEDCSIYARAWRFVQHRLHLRPRASSCPADMKNRATTKTVQDRTDSETAPVSNSYCCDWQRVRLLKELEEASARAQWRRQQRQFKARQECIKETAEWTPADVRVQPTFRTRAQRRTAQVTCYNCGLLFFSPLSVAPDTDTFCGLDCQRNFEYCRDLQDAVNDCETFRSTVSWTRSEL